MVTQVNSSSLGSVGAAGGAVVDLSARAKAAEREAAPQIARDSIGAVDARVALSSIQEGMANAVTALDVALRFGKQALGDLASGQPLSGEQLVKFAEQLRAADGPSAGLLTGGALSVRTSPEAAAVEIEGIDLRRLGSDPQSVKALGEALARFAEAADKLSSHARLAAVTQGGLAGVDADLSEEQARLVALDAAQALKGQTPALANAAPLSLLAFFQS
ncbi:MAG: hypothetical protein KJS97_14580 [Alphaproteobacteria bacterium]|nr:hypothetical protein [Alphaproteobacteria bacterium]